MSSHGYSTFFAFGSGTAAGFTTRTYSAASVFGALVTVSTNGTNVRCSCDFMKKGSSVMVMSLGAGWPAITPSTSFTTVSISCCSCLLRFLVVLLRLSLLRSHSGSGKRCRNHQRDYHGHRTPNCHHSLP